MRSSRAVYTKKASRDYPKEGIKKGDTYYTWQVSGKENRKSKEYPRKSEHTNSSVLRLVFLVEEIISYMKPYEEIVGMSADARRSYVLATVKRATEEAQKTSEVLLEMSGKEKTRGRQAQVRNFAENMLIWAKALNECLEGRSYDSPTEVEELLSELNDCYIGVQ